MHKAAGGKDRLEAVLQLLMQAVELVGVGGQTAGGDHLLQPDPLEGAGFIDTGGRVGVVFEQLRRAGAVIGEIEAAIERRGPGFPAVGDVIAGRFRDRQSGHQGLAAGHLIDEVEAERVKGARGFFDAVFDLGERELVVGAFVPVAGTVKVAPRETQRLSARVPAGAFESFDAFHRVLLTSPAERREGDHRPKSRWWRGRAAGSAQAER